MTTKKLMILESPNKIKHVKKYLGAGWEVLASAGHCRTIPSKGGMLIDTTKWEGKFKVEKGKEKIVANLRKAVKEVNEVYLAMDPDREGEAIAYHLEILLKPYNKKATFYRVTFNSITKKAIEEGLSKKHGIDMDMVNSQKTRAFLDRIIGYSVPSVIQSNIQTDKECHHSAGRVQSVALILLAERQKEIDAFIPDEYWNITSDMIINNMSLNFALTTFKNKALKIKNAERAIEIEKDILSNRGAAIISNVKETKKVLKPKPPLTTSTMQQDASTRLGFSIKKTMDVAQKLFESGLITYHRSDSVRLEQEQSDNARKYIEDTYGKKYVSSKTIVYKPKGKNVQDAHTAIQPTDVCVATVHGVDQQKLYTIIRNRFLACQAASCNTKTKTVTVKVNDYEFKTSGTVVMFDGYTKIMGKEASNEAVLPDIKKTDSVELTAIKKLQKYTKPPAYFNDASLVKTLEGHGVGRPSTYAAIMPKLISRKYVKKDGKKIVTLLRGIQAADFLKKEFSTFFNVTFTASMNNDLDEIALGKKEWKKVLDQNWKHLNDLIKAVKDSKPAVITTKKSCPLCGAKVLQKRGRTGLYYVCGTEGCLAKFDNNTGEFYEKEPDKETDIVCHLCKGSVLKKTGRFGDYFSCTTKGCKARFNKTTGEPIILEVVGSCLKCGKDVVKRINKRGNQFYACSGFPKCKTIYELEEDGTLSLIDRNSPKSTKSKSKTKTKKRAKPKKKK